MTETIHNQIQARLDELKAAFAAKTGAAKVYIAFETKFSSYENRPQFSISLTDGNYPRTMSVTVYHWDEEKPATVDDLFALCAQKIADYRTLADECADLGLPVPALDKAA